MKVIDVFLCYYEASCVANGRERHAAAVRLTATSDAGRITYEYSVSFFPHDEEDDFAVSYDACVSETVYDAKGRRSRKKEAGFLAELQDRVNALAAQLEGTIDWEKQLIEPRLG